MDLKRLDSVIQFISATNTVLDSWDTLLPNGVLVYCPETRIIKLGENKKWSETPVFMDLNSLDIVDNLIGDIIPAVNNSLSEVNHISDIAVDYESLMYYLMFYNSTYDKMYYNTFKTGDLTVTQGSESVTYDGYNRKYIIRGVHIDSPVILETNDLINSSAEFNEFIIHMTYKRLTLSGQHYILDQDGNEVYVDNVNETSDGDLSVIKEDNEVYLANSAYYDNNNVDVYRVISDVNEDYIYANEDTLDIEYSIDGGVTWRPTLADTPTYSMEMFNSIRFRFKVYSDIEFDSFGVFYSDTTSSSTGGDTGGSTGGDTSGGTTTDTVTHFRTSLIFSDSVLAALGIENIERVDYTIDNTESRVVVAPEPASSTVDITLPNSLAYLNDNKHLRIYYNRLVLIPGIDYIEKDDSSVTIFIKLYKNDILMFEQ